MSHDLPSATQGSARARDAALHDWVARWIEESGQSGVDWQLQSLGGDAGFRRYFRLLVQGEQTGLLVVDAPPATEDTPRFVAVANFLRVSGLRTPRLEAVDAESGFLLIEDLGDQLFQTLLDADTAPLLYGQALMTLLRLQQIPLPTGLVEDYDQPQLRCELRLFEEWFVTALLGYSLDDHERRLLARVYGLLESSALAQPRVLVHRDYHARNLLCCADGDLGVIDFQGALLGPCTYDPVSLLKDCYVRWPSAQVRCWSLSYANLAFAAGIIPQVDESTWLGWFDWMGLQRHLKVLGIFARLWLRDGRPHYLGDLSRVLGYVLEVTARYPDFAEFDSWLRTRLMPQVKTRDWYRAADLELDAV